LLLSAGALVSCRHGILLLVERVGEIRRRRSLWSVAGGGVARAGAEMARRGLEERKALHSPPLEGACPRSVHRAPSRPEPSLSRRRRKKHKL
jgi:hypothetical protein